ncbi:GLPGLI family protein [Tamlana fucoidanivorans]|uniref:GLPGLI family protein n=1 Tax=Allotamlana fucoidanivorans TaxID=2583814 RepID=A0A5C4SJC4_9FLAO|nr:GLPGLI family protein [Tamlana fucoidanivorans]TNJ43154.1 GLPGLI family protein [Tamlana fucoidanivorans]
MLNFNILKRCLGALFLLTIVTSTAQNNFQGKAYYQSKTSVDMSNFGGGQLSEERKKQIAARMKSALEKSFILSFNQSESVYKEEEKLDTPSNQSGGMRFSMMASGGGDQYKNVKTNKVVQEKELFGKKFLIKDSLQKLDWVLTGDTKVIGKYTCFKATAVKKKTGIDFSSFRRRDNATKPKDSSENTKEATKEEPEAPKKIDVVAWYTPQIPVNQGPDVYWGLPGLILEVNADRTTILCSKIIINPSDKEKLKEPTKGKEVTQEEYEAIVLEKTEEMREMFRSRRGGRR